MTVSKAQILANLKYRAKTYDRISIDVKKGKREEYKQAAKERGISLALIIQKGVEEYIRNHPPIKEGDENGK